MNEIQTMSNAINAYDHDLRQTILKLLQREPNMSVSELVTILDARQSDISRHLKVLRDAKLVSSERQGRYVYYRCNDKMLEALFDACNTYHVQFKFVGLMRK